MVKLVKMKLSATEKVCRKACLAELDSMGGFVMSVPGEKTTYCFCPVIEGNRRSKTWRMSVALCHENDKFSRKYGEWLAVQRMLEFGESIIVPAGYVFSVEGY